MTRRAAGLRSGIAVAIAGLALAAGAPACGAQAQAQAGGIHPDIETAGSGPSSSGTAGSGAEAGWWVIQLLTSDGLSPGRDPSSGADPVGLRLASDILFATGSSRLSDNARARLEAVAAEVRPWAAAAVVVVGHTDSTGTVAGNERLGLDRAEAVRVALVDLGLPAELLTVDSQGQRCPIATNDTAEGRSRNRRVEVLPTAPEGRCRQPGGGH